MYHFSAWASINYVTRFFAMSLSKLNYLKKSIKIASISIVYIKY